MHAHDESGDAILEVATFGGTTGAGSRRAAENDDVMTHHIQTIEKLHGCAVVGGCGCTDRGRCGDGVGEGGGRMSLMQKKIF